jgi:hypothetical protein
MSPYRQPAPVSRSRSTYQVLTIEQINRRVRMGWAGLALGLLVAVGMGCLQYLALKYGSLPPPSCPSKALGPKGVQGTG